MKGSNYSENYNTYKVMIFYIIIIINVLLMTKILYLLFPYINYGLRNNKAYVFLRDRLPFLNNMHKIF